MSAAFFNQLKHLAGQYAALQRSYDELAERVLALEAEKPSRSSELPPAEWEEPKGAGPKRRGRPPKVQA